MRDQPEHAERRGRCLQWRQGDMQDHTAQLCQLKHPLLPGLRAVHARRCQLRRLLTRRGVPVHRQLGQLQDLPGLLRCP